MPGCSTVIRDCRFYRATCPTALKSISEKPRNPPDPEEMVVFWKSKGLYLYQNLLLLQFLL